VPLRLRGSSATIPRDRGRHRTTPSRIDTLVYPVVNGDGMDFSDVIPYIKADAVTAASDELSSRLNSRKRSLNLSRVTSVMPVHSIYGILPPSRIALSSLDPQKFFCLFFIPNRPLLVCRQSYFVLFWSALCLVSSCCIFNTVQSARNTKFDLLRADYDL